MSTETIVKPVMSEKAYSSSQDGVYIFVVPKSASKQQVKQAVQNQYKVGVVGVRTFNQRGKAQRGLGRARGISGTRQDTRKAYVTLRKGDKLPFFESEEHDHNHDHDEKPKKSNTDKEKK